MHDQSSLLAPPPGCALFLDIDGTLLDLAPTPGSVTVPDELPALLRRLRQQREGALALITGRTLADVDRLFGASYAAAAEHGALLRDPSGQLHRLAAVKPGFEMLVTKLRADLMAFPGALLEQKQFGVVLHWRQAPALREVLMTLAAHLVAPHPDLMLLPAHEAVEIRPKGTGKDGAIALFMQREPFAGRLPLFIGDDLTDEPAIARVRAMGGFGLHVHHDFGGSPAAVRQWLSGGGE